MEASTEGIENNTAATVIYVAWLTQIVLELSGAMSVSTDLRSNELAADQHFFWVDWFLTGNKSSDSSFLDTTFVACPRHFHHETDSWRLGSTVSTVLSLFHETSLPYTDMQLSKQIRTFLRLERQLGKWLGG